MTQIDAKVSGKGGDRDKDEGKPAAVKKKDGEMVDTAIAAAATADTAEQQAVAPTEKGKPAPPVAVGPKSPTSADDILEKIAKKPAALFCQSADGNLMLALTKDPFGQWALPTLSDIQVENGQTFQEIISPGDHGSAILLALKGNEIPPVSAGKGVSVNWINTNDITYLAGAPFFYKDAEGKDKQGTADMYVVGAEAPKPIVNAPKPLLETAMDKLRGGAKKDAGHAPDGCIDCVKKDTHFAADQHAHHADVMKSVFPSYGYSPAPIVVAMQSPIPQQPQFLLLQTQQGLVAVPIATSLANLQQANAPALVQAIQHQGALNAPHVAAVVSA